MEDFSDNQGGYTQPNDETQEFSTVFSAPVDHTDKRLKSPKMRRILAIVSAVLSVCVLIGGTLAIIKFIPKKDNEGKNSLGAKTITVVNFDKSKFDIVKVKNENGEFVFYPEKTSESGESSNDSGIKWYLRNVDKDKTSISKIDTIVSAASEITADMTITEKSFEECGLADPIVQIDVKSEETGDYSITFGDTSPDNFGVYVYSSIDEKIYIVQSSIIDDFIFTALDLANTDAVPAVSVSDGSGKYVDGSGTLVSFDELKISGSKFEQPVLITRVSDDESGVALSYRIISPVSRYAESDSVSSVLNSFSSGISVSGVYCFDTDAAALSKFKLDKPDVAIKISVLGHSFTYSFAKQDDGFYALFGEGMNTIKKISASAVGYLSYGETDFYSKLVYLRPISDIKNMTFDFGGQTYSFDISQNGEDEEEKYTIIHSNKRLKSEYFQNFYMHFVSMSLINFSSYENTSSPDMTVRITDNGGAVQTLAFYKATATEYYCSDNGTPTGKITAATYNKLVREIKAVSNNKDVAN